MTVRVKYGDKRVDCKVAARDCVGKPCLHVGKFTHYNRSIDGVRSSWQNDYFSCLTRDYHGCPDFESEVRS